MLIKRFFFVFFFLLSSTIFCLNTRVTFSGLQDPKTLIDLEQNSSLFQHMKKDVRSLNSLRFRIANDLPTLKKVLQNHGYFDAIIDAKMTERKDRVLIDIHIQPGQRYFLHTVEILEKKPPLCSALNIKNLPIHIGEFYEAKNIGEARLKIIELLAICGHPLATIENQEILVNTEKKWVDVKVFLDQGVLCRFGPAVITGLSFVKPEFIQKKISWHEKDIYSTKKIEKTQLSLISSQLFSSVSILHGEDNEDHLLPVKIQLNESKHRSLSLGLSYATIDGFGTSVAWGHRNIRGMGEQLHFEGNLAQKNITGKLTYIKPDTFIIDQNYVAQATAERENIHVYLAFMYSLMNRFDWKINAKNYFSYGLEVSEISVNRSSNNGKYWELTGPLFYKYFSTKDILNPTSGNIFIYQPILSFIFSPTQNFYFKEKLTWCTFFPIGSQEKLSLAFRTRLNSIVGTPLEKIPMTELFFGGSDDDLRGYRYHTVSPKDKEGNLTGGRSAIYFSFEPRFRLNMSFGLVPFFDIGTLSKKCYPNPKRKWYKSIGIGLRYFTFFGPLRLDVGVPLNRRKGLDPHYRIYASIGQTF